MAAREARWEFTVTWGDLDSNQHMRNTAYLDYAAQSRFLFLAAHGFTPEAFRRQALGPVVLRDVLDYRRELNHLERFTLTLELAALHANGARFTLRNTFYGARGEEAALVRSDGAWFDLRARRITVPPAELRAAMDAMPRTSDFALVEPAP